MPTSFFWGCLPTVFRPRGAVFTCGADIYLRCFWDVYLRWFRLHSAGVSLSIPPVAPADVPAIPAQELGHLPAVLQTFTCGAETRLPCGGCIPPVAVAQSLARRLPFRKLPAVLSPPRRVWVCVYLRWLLRTCLQYPPKNWDIYLRWGRDVYA